MAAGLAWYVGGDLVGHARPFFAPVAAVISLGVSLASRLRRAAELAVGVSVGILVGDLRIARIGSGAWQIALVVALALTVAVFADGAALLVAQAGSSAVLVATLLPPGQSGGFDRWIDALIGGGVGVLVAAVLPTDPVGPVRKEARALLEELADVLSRTADALRAGDPGMAEAALARARASQPQIDALRSALSGGREVTLVSPLLRRRRRVLALFAQLAERSDYAMRNARVLARRTYTVLTDGEAVTPDLADAMNELSAAVGTLTSQLGRDGDRERVREPVLDVVRHAVVMADGRVHTASETLLVAQQRRRRCWWRSSARSPWICCRPRATGLARAEALAAMRGTG